MDKFNFFKNVKVEGLGFMKVEFRKNGASLSVLLYEMVNGVSFDCTWKGEEVYRSEFSEVSGEFELSTCAKATIYDYLKKIEVKASELNSKWNGELYWEDYEDIEKARGIMIKVNDKVELKDNATAVRLGYFEPGARLTVNKVIERKGCNPGEDYFVYMISDGGRMNVAVYEGDIKVELK